MPDISLITLNILAFAKVILAFYVILLIIFIFKVKKPLPYLCLTGGAVILFYLILSWPLQRMWWGNVGDELFTLAYLGKSLLGNPWHDFYYDWLPNFYPPLYFWVTGLISRLFTDSAVAAAKIGVLGTLTLWFFGSYWWQRFFWQRLEGKPRDEIAANQWFWFLLSAIYLLLLDFDSVILKPYEAIAALFAVILMGAVGRSFYRKHWALNRYLFLGITGGLIFLTFYFWWLILIPALFILAGLTKKFRLNFQRLLKLGLIIFLISAVFILPLFWSFMKYGLENDQGTYLIPFDFSSWLPWFAWSLVGFLYLAGLIGLLIFSRKSFVKSSLAVLAVCYFYQLVNILYYLTGHRPFLPSKPFWFLGTAAIAVGLTYLLIYFYQKYSAKASPTRRKFILIAFSLLLIGRFPFAHFVDEPLIIAQIEKDLSVPNIISLAEEIKNQVPDYQERTWLSSGSLELNAYLPISYYIGHTVHFSHQAAAYSRRMAEIKSLSLAKTPAEFMAIINQGQPRAIDALLLHDNSNGQSEVYTLYFWQDNFPNGGQDAEIKLPKKLIIDQDWQLVSQQQNWLIYIKR